MNLPLFVRSLLPLGATLLPISVSAQLAIWDVNGISASTNSPLSATTLAANISSGTVTLGSGVTASTAASTFGGSGFNSTDLSSAIADGDYIAVNLTIANGYSASLSSISFNSEVATAVTNFNVALLASSSAYSADNVISSFSFSTATAPAQSITLSAIAGLQNLTGSIEFRLYGWRDASGTSTYRIRNLSGNDLVVAGTVSAVPEPSTYATILGAITLVATALRRRSAERHRLRAAVDGVKRSA